MKVKAGLIADAAIPTSLPPYSASGLECLCDSVSVFTTKTSGVQQQIQGASVVFVGHFNLVPHLFCPSPTSQVAADVFPSQLQRSDIGGWLQ